jgi:hypothetical protein
MPRKVSPDVVKTGTGLAGIGSVSGSSLRTPPQVVQIPEGAGGEDAVLRADIERPITTPPAAGVGEGSTRLGVDASGFSTLSDSLESQQEVNDAIDVALGTVNGDILTLQDDVSAAEGDIVALREDIERPIGSPPAVGVGVGATRLGVDSSGFEFLSTGYTSQQQVNVAVDAELATVREDLIPTFFQTQFVNLQEYRLTRQTQQFGTLVLGFPFVTPPEILSGEVSGVAAAGESVYFIDYNAGTMSWRLLRMPSNEEEVFPEVTLVAEVPAGNPGSSTINLRAISGDGYSSGKRSAFDIVFWSDGVEAYVFGVASQGLAPNGGVRFTDVGGPITDILVGPEGIYVCGEGFLRRSALTIPADTIVTRTESHAIDENTTDVARANLLMLMHGRLVVANTQNATVQAAITHFNPRDLTDIQGSGRFTNAGADTLTPVAIDQNSTSFMVLYRDEDNDEYLLAHGELALTAGIAGGPLFLWEGAAGSSVDYAQAALVLDERFYYLSRSGAIALSEDTVLTRGKIVADPSTTMAAQRAELPPGYGRDISVQGDRIWLASTGPHLDSYSTGRAATRLVTPSIFSVSKSAYSYEMG